MATAGFELTTSKTGKNFGWSNKSHEIAIWIPDTILSWFQMFAVFGCPFFCWLLFITMNPNPVPENISPLYEFIKQKKYKLFFLCFLNFDKFTFIFEIGAPHSLESWEALTFIVTFWLSGIQTQAHSNFNFDNLGCFYIK